MARYFNDFFGPLRRWCHAILPTVYDDSLSYYEVLCKLSRHVNDLGDIINNIINTGTWDAVVAYTRPEFFGAVGDGTETDDSDAVQSALNDGQENNKIVLLSKNYLIGKTLDVPEGAVVVGQNGGGLRSKRTQISGFVPTTLVNISGPCYFNNVVFDGNSPAGDSQAVGDRDNHNPLVRIRDASNVFIDNCKFINYDTNWSNNVSSTNYAALSAKSSNNISITNCNFIRIRRECTVFEDCEYVNIEKCFFNMGSEIGNCYSDIGLGLTNYVRVSNCEIQKGNLTTSAINAMGNYIIIENCIIKAPYSDFGIDYGNEVGIGFTATDLTIRGCSLNCHISGASDTEHGITISHDNIRIHDNIIDCTNVSGSGKLYLYGTNGEHFNIYNNIFMGEVTGTNCAIRIGENVRADITGNTFRVNGVRFGSTSEGINILNNTFETDLGIFVGATAETPQDLPILCCKFYGNTGRVVSNSNFDFIMIGCYLGTGIVLLPSTAHYGRVDNSLSYIAHVGKGDEPTPDPEEHEEPSEP